VAQSDEFPSFKKYSESWGQIRKRFLKAKNNLIFKIFYILVKKKNFSLSPFSVSGSLSPKRSCLVPRTSLNGEWKADILLQNQRQEQQSNNMIHKLQVDLIMKNS